MSLRTWHLCLTFGVMFFLGSAAQARAAFELDDLELLAKYSLCEQECSYGSRADYPECVSQCGSTSPDWDIDANGKIDTTDYKRGLRKYWGDPDCAGADAGRDVCRDLDNDQLRRWQEDALGTVDAAGAANRQTMCTNGVACGFAARCTFANPSQPEAIPLDVGYCAARPGCANPTANTCTAFHLEAVEQTDREVVVHVYFDHAPIDTRVLDLHIRVPRKALQLTNARALPILEEAGKAIEVRDMHLDAAAVTELRLMVFGKDNTRPIPHGAIAELVFTRVSGAESGTITFSTDLSKRRRAMAPNPDPTPDPASPLDANHLWGSAVPVNAVGATTPKLALYYSFDEKQLTPGTIVVPSEDEACGLLFDCNASKRAKYTAMQRGVVEAEAGGHGVTGPGAFFDGYGDHVEMPVVFNDVNLSNDNFSLSFWFYHEGDERGSGSDEQVLFAHNTGTTKNGFGVVLKPADDGTFALEWFEGDRVANTTRTALASGLPDRKWLYFAASLAANGTGGADVTTYVRMPTRPDAPEEEDLSKTTVVHVSDMVKQCLGTQQGKLALVEPIVKNEAIFYASARNNLFGIARMDPNGLSRLDVLRDRDSTALDPDFHPGNGKVVFVSSRTGNYELWLANADGSEPVQVTTGFGGTATGRFVRHPRWSPNGKGIVFESNAASGERFYNTQARGYQLYYVGYDPIQKKVVVPTADGQPDDMLSFSDMEQANTFYRYTLTGTTTNGKGNRNNYVEAHWLGNGRLVANMANDRFENMQLVWFDVAGLEGSYAARNNITRDNQGTYGVGDGDVHLLAAGERDGVVRTLFAEEQSHYDDDLAEESYRLGAPVWDGDEVSVRVTYVKDHQSFPDYCWDRNSNRSCDSPDENPDGVGSCDKLDCQPAELRDLFVMYDEDLEPVVDQRSGRVSAEAGPWILEHKPVENDANGGLEVAPRFSSTGAYMTVQVLSETSAKPIPKDTLLGTLRFRLKNGKVRADVGADGFTAMVRRVEQRIMLSENDQPTLPVRFKGGVFERITGAAFSPGLDRVVVAGIQDARPMLATSESLEFMSSEDPHVSASLAVISSAPMRVEGLSWRSFEAAFNCNWMGAYRQPSTGLYDDAFRGGLDEVRYYNGTRTERAIQSEFERAEEWLIAHDQDGVLGSHEGECDDHLDCAAYEQCWDKEGDGSRRCDPRPCDSQDDCGLEGSCRLMPVPVSQERPTGETTPEFVCAVDCQTSSQCYAQECLNGPCMFCQAGTCAECQRSTGEFGIEYVEGCPDRNSFMCDQGSCVSECYSFENGVSRYLCDTATEYCRQGRCVLFDWDWPDLSPATFSGMGEMLSENHGGEPGDALIYTEATAQFHTVMFEAYGVGDYLNAPEVAVQVHGASMYGGDGWFELGRVMVYNQTSTEADNTSRQYRLTSPYPFDGVRLRLVLPPYQNLNGAATGLGSKLAALCDGKATNCLPREQTNPGSRTFVGYRVGIPEHVARRHSVNHSQLTVNDGLEYLYGGQPAVIVKRLFVESVSSRTQLNLTSLPQCPEEGGGQQGDEAPAPGTCAINTICPYDGGASDTNPARALDGVQLIPAPLKPYGEPLRPFNMAGPGYGLLNCVWNPPVQPGAQPAQAAELRVMHISKDAFHDAQTGRPNDGKHIETPNSCFVESNVGGEPVFTPCFETFGSDPNFDPYNQESQAYRTLDIDTFQSFGYELEQDLD